MAGEKEAKLIIDKSGNQLHSKVVNLLRAEGWFVLVSPYYSDNFTEKPREIDIIAEKKFAVNDFVYGRLGTLNIRLFIECKYLNGKTVFWFDSKDKTKAAERIKKDTGMEHPHNDISKLHHNDDASVAKLFSSEKDRRDEPDLWSKAINQNLNALVYYRGRTDLAPFDKRQLNRPLLHVSYPLIACNSFDNLYRTDIADEYAEVESIKEPFQLEVNYAYTNMASFGINEYFLIDVVNVNQLSAFLKNLENTDISAIKEKILWQKHMERK